MSPPGLLVYFSAVFAATSCFPEQGGDDMLGARKSVLGGNGRAEELTSVFLDEEEVNFNTANVKDFFEGDIILTLKQTEQMLEDQQKEMEEGRGEKGAPEQQQQQPQHVQARAVVRDLTSTWPDAVVPYVLSSKLPNSHVTAIRTAMNVYTKETCIRFVPRTTQRDFVVFFAGSGCYSYIGRVGGAQEISIGNGCQHIGIVLHEIFHALGRWHEQSRPDRDNYITIHFNNIRRGLEEQFARLSSSYATTNGIGYDYFSIMHYSAYAFSRKGDATITPRNPSIRLGSLGQREGFTNRDLQHVNKLYCNSQVAPSQWSSWSGWSQCSSSCGSDTQTRTRSCPDSTCEGSSTSSRSCTGTDCPGVWSSWGSWGSCTRSCGTNRVRSRSRTCEGPGECIGAATQRSTCADVACPEDTTGMSEWSPWTFCSRVCNGYQLRRRHCVDASLGCSPPYYQLQRCSVGRCHTNWFRFREQQQQQQQQDQKEKPLQDDPGASTAEPTSAGIGLSATPVKTLIIATTLIGTLLSCAI